MHLCGWEGVQVYVVFTHACVVSVDMCCVLLCEVCNIYMFTWWYICGCGVSCVFVRFVCICVTCVWCLCLCIVWSV